MKKLALLLILIFFGVQVSVSQSVQPDIAFGINGIVKTDLGIRFKSQFGNAGIKVLTASNGSIFTVVEARGETYITKKFPNGSRDYSYGSRGFSYIAPVWANDAVLQKDGKILVAGFINDNLISNFALARFNADGSMDNTFSGDGILTTVFPQGYSFANSVALQPDEKILVAGYINGDFGVVRYNVNGLPDSTFSADGIQTTDFDGQTDIAESVKIQKNGKIVVAGSITNGAKNDFAVARYNEDGSPDTTFSQDGKQLTDFGGFDNGYAATIQDDGKIVVAGLTSSGAFTALALARYNEDGSPDSSFDGDGKQVTGAGKRNYFSVTSLTLQTNRKIVIAASSSLAIGDSYDFTVLRFNVDGSIDSSFAGKGLVTTNFNGGNEYARSAAIQKDGKILVTGETDVPGTTTDFGMARYNTDGSLDSTFSGDGKLHDNLKQGNTVYKSTTVQEDGKIIAAGYTWNGSNFKFAVSRFNTDGHLDSTFSGDGTKTTFFGSGDDLANAVAIQHDGKIVVAGSTFNGRNVDFAFARFTTKGELDSTFSTDGKQTISFGSTARDYANAVAIQNDGKILAAGVGKNSTALVRLTANGELDPAFAGDGKQVTAYSNSSVAKALALQADGKILAAGNSATNYTLARYSSNGYLDKTFGVDGKLEGDLGYGFNSGNGIAIQGDGKIVLAADVSFEEFATGFAIARFTQSGRPDSSFGIKGKVVPDDVSSYVNAVAIQTNGKIVAAGSNNNHSSITRININGSIDSAFGTKGTEVIQVSGAVDVIYSIATSDDQLYAAGTCQCPGNLGTLIKFRLEKDAVPPIVNRDKSGNRPAILSRKEGSPLSRQTIALSLSPNPANNILHISVAGARGDKTMISLISLSGVTLKTVELATSTSVLQLDTGPLKSGMYIIRVTNRNGVTHKQFQKF